jgi:hypothetical protein
VSICAFVAHIGKAEACVDNTICMPVKVIIPTPLRWMV